VRTRANSIAAGDKLLTTGNAGDDRDAALFAKLGIAPMRVERAHLEAAEVIAAE
jgi:biotin synthase